MTTVEIRHSTRYRFDRAVFIYPHVVRLRPSPHALMPIQSYRLSVLPETHFVNWQQDPFGNYQARYVFQEKATSLSIDVALVVELIAINPFDFFLEQGSEQYPFDYAPELKRDLTPFLERADSGPLLQHWASSLSRDRTPIIDFLVSLNQRVADEIGYIQRYEPGIQSCEQTLELRSGSCRDSAWLLVQILRSIGLAARFVSGYLVQIKGRDGPKEDFTDLHAWTEVYLPGAGWIGLDPSSGMFAGEGHIPLACAPSATSVAAITGSTEPCEVEFSYHNEVKRL